MLEEGDRLMELGFEETIGSIPGILEKKSKLPKKGEEAVEWKSEAGLPRRRVSMLCSATINTNAQRLGDISLKEALYIKAEKGYDDVGGGSKSGEEGFQAPAELKQSYVVVPAKLRLVEFNAILKRALVRQTSSPQIIVFFSCSDLVGFDFQVFSRFLGDSSGTEPPKPTPKPIKPSKSSGTALQTPTLQKPNQTPPTSQLNCLHRTILQSPKPHTSTPPPSSTNSTAPSHSQSEPRPSTPLHTQPLPPSPSAPTLLPANVDPIIQFDPVFSRDDHLHCIGRTARAGYARRAIMFLPLGTEEGYVDAVLKKCGNPIQAGVDEVFKKGFGEE